MDQTGVFVVFFAVLMVVNSEEESCMDKIFGDETGVKCCKTINDSNAKDEDLARIDEKCLQTPDQDECEIIKCIYKESGVMVGDKINATALIEQNLGGKNQATWRKPITDAVNTCMTSMTKKQHPEEYLMDCIAVMMFTNCPKIDWTENEKCSGLKKNVQKCL